jgi:ABC-type lipoprotein export system ATPase subunit
MMLTVQGLSKQFVGDRNERKVDAVADVNLDLEAGRFLAIVGRSGSGKSTLLGMIGGISRPTSGTILLDGYDQWSLSDNDHSDLRNQKIGFVFQFASLLPTLRAIDNVALPAIIGGAIDKHQAYARAHALLDRVGLAERLDSYPGTLSGGEQRRVAIARALINSPQLLLADEPTADLDEETEEEILNLLVDIQQAFNLTLVVVTHNLAIAERADNIIEMSNGIAKSRLHSSRNGKLEHLVAARSGAENKTAQSEAARNHIRSHPEHYEPTRTSAGNQPAHRDPMRAGADNQPDTTASTARSPEESSNPNAAVKQLFEIPSEAASTEKVRLGEGIDRFIGRIVMLIIPIVIAAWAANWAIAYYQDHILEAKADAQSALEDLAMNDLRADLKGIEFGPGNSYEITVYLKNTKPTEPIYVMSPTVRAFVQLGTNWQEVPIKQADSVVQQVQKISGTQLYHYVIEPNVPGFTELLPFYMHVRISNDMLVSPSSQPKDDLIERNDNYYVYLKPHNTDDKKILSKMKFPGAPPVWIPMPPH